MSGEAVVNEAPSSTNDIAANVIETAEAQDASSDVQTQDATPPPAPEPPPTAAELSEAAKYLQAKGHRSKTQDGRDTWLKFNTVEKFLDDYVSTHRGTWDGRYSALEKEKAELAAFRDELINDVKGEDTKRFLERIAEFNPAFRSYLQPAQPQAQAAPVSEKPQADIDLGNGRWAYSVEQNEKLVEWKAQQLLDARLKPFEDQQKASAERTQQEQAQQQLQTRVTSQIEAAKQWPNWSEHEPAVLKLLQDDSEKARAEGRRPTMTLREAYQEAQIQYLSAEDSAKRQRWIDESNKAAKSTAVTRSGVEQIKPQGPRSISEIAREVISKSS